MEQSTSASHPATMAELPQGTQIALQMSAEPSADDLQFAQQLGVKYVVLWTDGAHAGRNTRSPALTMPRHRIA
jgi:hypothetical protein